MFIAEFEWIIDWKINLSGCSNFTSFIQNTDAPQIYCNRPAVTSSITILLISRVKKIRNICTFSGHHHASRFVRLNVCPSSSHSHELAKLISPHFIFISSCAMPRLDWVLAIIFLAIALACQPRDNGFRSFCPHSFPRVNLLLK